MSLTAPHQVAGPIYGAALHAVGGLRLPYLGAAALCALTSLAFLATAAVGSPTSTPTSSATSSPTAEAAEGGAAAVAVAAAAGGPGGVVPDSPPAAARSESGQPMGRVQPWGGALRDAPTWRLCAFQALCCGTVRSCLDILLP